MPLPVVTGLLPSAGGDAAAAKPEDDAAAAAAGQASSSKRLTKEQLAKVRRLLPLAAGSRAPLPVCLSLRAGSGAAARRPCTHATHSQPGRLLLRGRCAR
jgi:hypothetical protein